MYWVVYHCGLVGAEAAAASTMAAPPAGELPKANMALLAITSSLPAPCPPCATVLPESALLPTLYSKSILAAGWSGVKLPNGSCQITSWSPAESP